MCVPLLVVFFFSSRRRHTRYWRDWSSDVCSSDLPHGAAFQILKRRPANAAQHQKVIALFRGRSHSLDRKSTRLNSSHANISYAVFCLKKKKKTVRAVKILKEETTKVSV